MAAATITGVSIPPGRARRTRPALEWVLAAAPPIARLGLMVLARLPATSRLRRRALQEAFSRGFAALNRRDPWPIPIVYEPDCEIGFAGDFQMPGFDLVYRGHFGWHEMIDAVRESLPDVRWEPERLIDLGDRWVVRLGLAGSGRTSGAPGQQTWGSVYHVTSRGRIARQDMYWTWEETLSAAGLREDR